MTIAERTELVDSLTDVDMALEKAQCIMQEISDEYFEKYLTGNKENEFSIVFEFRRNRILFRVLSDIFYQIKSVMPAPDWASSLQATQE